ncbi:MAG: extracellular solute-binding protein [Chloroflexi bacterium]|nr:extracellular solute-binding protein [Chloroflexota bacterium]
MVRPTGVSRRNLLGVLGAGTITAIVAACGGAPASPTAAPTKPAAAAPTTAPAAKPAEATKPAAAAATTPAAAATTAPAAKPAAGGGAPVALWSGVDYLPEVHKLLFERAEAIAKEKGFTVALEELTGPAAADKFPAAVAANTPPDIYPLFDYQTQYWRIQGQTLDVDDIVKPLTTQAGGFWKPVEMTCFAQGKWWAVPRAINCWPFHVRQDLLDKAGLKFPKNWEEFRAQGRQLTKAPLYYYGMTLGKINDTNNHVTAMAWTYGGKLQNEDGTWAVKAGDKGWLETLAVIQAMYVEDKIIPPGAINWDDGANNQGFQSEQLVVTSNPTSIFNWLRINKPELAKATKFYGYPAGPAGAVGQVDSWNLGLFKNGKATENAKVVLAGTLDLKWYNDYINNQMKGRFVPVFKDMIKADIWKDPLYDQYQAIIENGRIMSYAGTPQTATAEVTTRFIIGDMMQDLLVKKQKPEEALATFAKAGEEIYAKPENRR